MERGPVIEIKHGVDDLERIKLKHPPYLLLPQQSFLTCAEQRQQASLCAAIKLLSYVNVYSRCNFKIHPWH
jgi:hypothetical protein